MSTYFLPGRENRIAQEPSFSALAPPASLKGTAWGTFWLNTFWMPRVCTGNRIFFMMRGKSDHTPWRLRHGNTFFWPPQVWPCWRQTWFHASQCETCPHRAEPEHHLQIQQRYTWLNAQACISSKLKLWTIYCIPCYKIFTFLVLGVMLTHLVIHSSMFW